MSPPKTSADTDTGSAAPDNVVTDELSDAVQECCALILNDRERSNYVKPKYIQDMPCIQECFTGSIKDRVKNRRIRYALEDAEYTEKWGKDTFQLDSSKLAHE